MSVNKVILLGNVGQDPEMRYLDSGKAVAKFSLATTEKGYTLPNGTQVPDRTEWHNIIVWGGQAEVAEKYVKKGSQLYIEGKITTRKWEKDGIARYSTEIVCIDLQLIGGRKPESGGYNPEETTYTGQPNQQPPVNDTRIPGFAGSDGSDGSDDLPF